MGKLFVFLGLVDQAAWGALVAAVIGAAAGFYYYFKTILAMYTSDPSSSSQPIPLNLWIKVGAIALAISIVVLGVYPRPLQNMLMETRATASAPAH